MTATQPGSYPYPPIREAIFSVVFDEAISLDDLDTFCTLSFLGEGYESSKEVLQVKLETGRLAKSEDAPRKTIERNGRQWQSKDGNTSLQITRTFLSFHRVKRYTTWEDLQSGFLHALRQLQQTLPSCTCSNLSVRTINHIRIPDAGGEPFEDYLPLFLTVPDENFPTSLGQFFIQLQVTDETETLLGIIAESRLPREENNEMALLLDITVTQPGSFDSNTEGAEAQLVPVRNFKNRLFESCITDKVRKYFFQPIPLP